TSPMQAGTGTPLIEWAGVFREGRCANCISFAGHRLMKNLPWGPGGDVVPWPRAPGMAEGSAAGASQRRAARRGSPAVGRRSGVGVAHARDGYRNNQGGTPMSSFSSRMRLGLLALAVAVAIPVLAVAAPSTTPKQKSLYLRLGGKKGVTAVVNDFVTRLG